LHAFASPLLDAVRLGCFDQLVGHLLILENHCQTSIVLDVQGEAWELPGEQHKQLTVGARATIAVYDSVGVSFPTQMSEHFALRVAQKEVERVWHREPLLNMLKATKSQRNASVVEWVLSGSAFCPADQ